VSSEKKFHIQQHIGRDKHKNELAKIENSKKIQPFNKIWMCIDETTDSERRNVANIIVGILQPETPGNLYLLHTDYLDKVNSSTITQLLDKAMHILWPTNVKYDNILLFISDAAPYMKKAGSTYNSNFVPEYYSFNLFGSCMS